jgi:predicted permease
LRINLRILFRRLAHWLRREQLERDLAEELETHRSLRQAHLEESGMPAGQAAQASHRALGNITLAHEDVHEIWVWRRLEEVVQDLCHGVRLLRRSPGFTSVAVLSLAVGIGANTAIFTLVDAVVLKTLPVEEPEQLVVLERVNTRGERSNMPYQLFEALRAPDQNFSGVFAALDGTYRLEMAGQGSGVETDPVRVQAVSGEYFQVLGVRAAVGRTLTVNDDQMFGSEPVAVLSYGFWRRRFAGDLSVIGQRVTVKGQSIAIIGVAPAPFFGEFVGRVPDLWVPLALQPALDPPDVLKDPRVGWLRVMARLQPGTDLRQAQESLNVRLHNLKTDSGPFGQSLRSVGAIALSPGSQGLSDTRTRFSKQLLILMAVVGVVLLIACANVANLLLVRGAARSRETAIRLAIGAGRGRLVRQLVVESGALALVGAVAGLVGVRFLLLAAQRVPQGVVPGLEHLSISPRVLAFSLGATMLTTLVAGLVPALRASGVDIQTTLKRAGRSGSSHGSHRLRELLVVSQVALAMLLLVGGSLMIRSVVRLTRADIGLVTEHVWTVPLSLPSSRYPEEWQQNRFYNVVAGRIAALPGIRAVGATAIEPYSGANLVNDVTPEERAAEYSSAGYLQAEWRIVSPGYFEASGVPLLRGRDFSALDREDGAPVAIVSRTLADRLWPGQDAVGKRLFWGGTDGTPRTVVGVAGDISDVAVQRQTPMMFLSTRQFVWPAMALIVRAERDIPDIAAQIRRAVWAEDAGLPVPIVRPLADSRSRAIATPRLGAMILGLFAGVAVTLALVGLYGVLSYAVVERTREIGIRMALGAQPGAVVGLLVRKGIRLAILGIVLGLGSAMALAPLMQEMLYRTTAADPAVLALAPLALAAVAALAAFVPARRAARVDPVMAFRSE